MSANVTFSLSLSLSLSLFLSWCYALYWTTACAFAPAGHPEIVRKQSAQVLSETVDEELVHHFYSILSSSFEAIHAFVSRIPSFMDLDKEDQESLFHSATLELFSLRFAHR